MTASANGHRHEVFTAGIQDLVELYIALVGTMANAATEETLITAPRPRSTRPGRAARVSRAGAITWT